MDEMEKKGLELEAGRTNRRANMFCRTRENGRSKIRFEGNTLSQERNGSSDPGKFIAYRSFSKGKNNGKDKR